VFIEEFDGLDPMEPDPELSRGFAERAKILNGRWFSDMTPAEARATFARLQALHRDTPEARREIGEVSDAAFEAEGLRVGVRVYRPRTPGPHPVVVFFHGGGWVFGSVDTYDPTARAICEVCDVVVASVDYPLAPEHPFPTPFLCCVASVEWVKQNIAAFGGDPDAVVVMGDSAGANLAGATALECTRRGIELTGQAIVYGPFAHIGLAEEVGLRPWAERDQRFGPTLTATSWYWGNYLADAAHARDERASVLLQEDMKGAPPAVITAGVLDTFCEESRAYGHRLADSGVKASITRYPRLPHGYLTHVSLPREHRSQLAYEASMHTLGKVRELARS
jgi:Esterase/lipase